MFYILNRNLSDDSDDSSKKIDHDSRFLLYFNLNLIESKVFDYFVILKTPQIII